MISKLSPLTNCPDCGYNLKGLPLDHRCPECGFRYSNSDRIFVEGKRSVLFTGAIFCFAIALSGVYTLCTGVTSQESLHVEIGILVRDVLKFMNCNNSWATNENIVKFFAVIFAFPSFIIGVIFFRNSKKKSHILIRDHEIRMQEGSFSPVIIPWVLVSRVEETVRLNSEKRRHESSDSLAIVLQLVDGTEEYIPDFCYTSDETREEMFCLITERIKNNHKTLET